MGKTTWTPEELEILRAEYPKHKDRIPSLLKRHSATAIASCASRLGIVVGDTNSSCRKWSEREVDIIKRYYPTEGRAVAKRLPGRSEQAVSTEAQKLGARFVGIWTGEQDAIIKEKYPTQGSDIPELSQYTRRQICSRAALLGVSREYWSKAEDDILVEKYPNYGSDIPELKHKSVAAIQTRASTLGLKFDSSWRPEEIKKLRESYAAGKVPEMERHSRGRVLAKASELGLRIREVWSNEEDCYIRRHYPKDGAEGVQKFIPKRTINSIRRRAAQLGVKSEYKYGDKTEDVGKVAMAADGYEYIKCKVCGLTFLVEQGGHSSFKHSSHGVGVPEGWRLPYWW